MPRYADPTLCPDCRTTLPADPVSCPRCALPLQGPDAATLFHTLQTADVVLARLRASAALVPPQPATRSADWSPEAYPAPARAATAAPARRGLSAASVPRILLGLGALCLLVAAVTFLAVAWSWLGIGGRTTVLVGLTAVTGGLGVWLGGRGLRIAAESLTVVSLGLLVLDVVGADDAGWLGPLDLAGVVAVIGGVLLVAALGLLFAPARLVSCQVVAAVGLGTLAMGLTGVTEHDRVVAATAVLAFTALTQLGRTLGVRVLPWVAAAGAATWWTSLAAAGLLEATDHTTLRALWLEGHGWTLVTAAALLLLPAALARTHQVLAAGCVAAAATVGTVALGVPALDEGVTALAATALGFLVVWSAVAVVTPVRWGLVPRAPLALTTLPVLAVSAALLAAAIARVLDLGDPFTRDAGARLSSVSTDAHPALLVPALAALVLAAAVLLPVTHRLAARVPWSGAVVALLLAGAATLALTPVPLWTVVASVAVAGAVLLGDAPRHPGRTGTALAAGGAVVLVAAVVAALPSAVLTTGAVAVLVAAMALVEVTGRFPEARLLSGSLLPVATAGLLWSACEVAGVDDCYRAAPVLVVVGALAILRPRLPLESSAALAALVTTVASVAAAGDQPTSLAIHLTLAGALVSASAVVTPSRRPLGWLGGLLLAAATWVRLADLGVQAPEAYTLPTAVALVLVGLRRLYVDPEASTGLALVPGLALATTPSLLWVLADGLVSLRAVLLGLACLGLVLAGTWLRWSAALVVGAAVGAVLVLAELAPYVLVTPQWIVIGAAGTLLTVVGVTWERRLRDLRLGLAYLGRLR